MGKPFILRGTINDRLHGGVSITDEELGIINHRIFLRLHNIRQLGNLYLVFPSATHTRFEHCIGVMDLADRLFLAVKLESEKISNQLAPLDLAAPGMGVRLYELDKKVEEQLRRTLRICGLVHDLGHGPFSHNFEPFTPKVEEIAKLLNDPRLAVLQPYKQAVLKAKHGRVTHEAISVILFTVLWSETNPGDTEMPSALAAVLLNAPPVGVAPELTPWIPFIRDIVSSAPIDADRMDYLERDSRAVGTNYGLFDHARIFKSVLCVKDAYEENAFRLGWREDGLATVAHFVHARYQMFRQIYIHKTYRAMELMLEEIGKEADTNGLTLVFTSSVDALVHSYERLTDDHFTNLISGNAPSDLLDNERIMKLGRAFKGRRLWKQVIELDLRHHEDEIFAKLQDEFPNEKLILDKRPLNAMKDMQKATCLLRKSATGRYEYAGLTAWKEASVILDALRDTPESATRIYLAREGDSEILPLLRQVANALKLQEP